MAVKASQLACTVLGVPCSKDSIVCPKTHFTIIKSPIVARGRQVRCLFVVASNAHGPGPGTSEHTWASRRAIPIQNGLLPQTTVRLMNIFYADLRPPPATPERKTPSSDRATRRHARSRGVKGLIRKPFPKP